MHAQPTLSCIVTIGDDRPFAEVAADLAQAGLTIEQSLDSIGSVIGTVSHAALPRLRCIPGVLDVSEDQPIQLPPQDGSMPT